MNICQIVNDHLKRIQFSALDGKRFVVARTKFNGNGHELSERPARCKCINTLFSLNLIEAESRTETLITIISR